MKKIVTKDWLKDRLFEIPMQWAGSGPYCFSRPATYSETVAVIGRALVAIFNNQTSDEKSSLATKYANGRGFSHAHSRVGSISAKEFLATGTLPERLTRFWLQEKRGYPRICYYANQLNVIANEKEAIKISS